MATVGRRIGGVAIDWALCLVVSYGLLKASSLATLALFFVEQVLLVGTLGYGVGHRLVGVRVARVVDGGLPGWGRAFLRTFLLCLVLPAIVFDSDSRGAHDVIAKTVVLRR